MGSDKKDLLSAYMDGYERGRDEVADVMAELNKMKAALMEVVVPLEALPMSDCMSPYDFSYSLRSELRSAAVSVRKALTGQH
jgi:hypothetical protein